MKLTDLEGATLAAIAHHGKATAYAVAQDFAQSPSEFWSGSAGAVYPLVKRLATRGLITGNAAADGKRARIDYLLTAAGTAALENWLLDAKRASGMGFDPLRTRLVYLHLVKPEQRRAFLTNVRVESLAMAARPAFVQEPLNQRIHMSWLKARATWLAMLDFVA
jgi:DNA-binding PadR family transcriptional regulator